MYVRRLELANFRCYRELDLVLPEGHIVLAGPNAAGKSTVLEALFVLATTRSPHASSDRELIHWDAPPDMPFSRVVGEVVRRDGRRLVEVILARDGAGGGTERFTRRVRVDGTPRRAIDAVGHLKVVLFTPRDLQLVDGGPAERRRFMDVLLCHVDPLYCRALGMYGRVVTQRNHLLRRLRDRGGDRGELAFWDARLVESGSVVVLGRAVAMRDLAREASELHAELAGDGPPLAVAYRGPLDGDEPRGAATASADGRAAEPSATSVPVELANVAGPLADLLARRRAEEIARGVTVVGPHRDDLALSVGGVDVRAYGSRGQQRTVALALKLAEARMMARRSDDLPVLLLDDVLSELDVERREHLIAHIAAREQALVTTTDLAAVPRGLLERAHVLHVRDGNVLA